MERISKWLFILLLFAGCTKDAEFISRDYPFVLTQDVEVHENGVTLKAEIVDLGKEEIIQYGFVWSDRSLPTISNSHEFVKGNPAKGFYQIDVDYDLRKKQNYYVRGYILTKKSIVYGNEIIFTSLGSNPPVITDFNPKFGPIGTVVIIDGNNFSQSIVSDTLKFGDKIAVIDSVFKDHLYTHVPEVTIPEKVNLFLTCAGLTTKSDQQFDIWFPWTTIKNNRQTNSTYVNFMLFDKVYFIGYYMDKMVSYQPESNIWKEEFSIPVDDSQNGDIYYTFNVNNIGYYFFNNELWSFDPQSITWSKKAKFPGVLQSDEFYRYGMCSKGKIYLGNCYKSNELWEYNPDNDSWSRKADFIENYSNMGPVWGRFVFSANGKVYLGINHSGYKNTFWEYDPDRNYWSEKAPYPGLGYSHYSSFVIKEEGFVGLGYSEEWSDGYVSGDLWKYNTNTDKWVPYRNCPHGMSVTCNFVFEDKGYILAETYEYDDSTNDIWIFDPSKN
jgi:hypothetical protein